MAALRAQGGDDLGAINLLNALAANVQIWLDQNPDADIEDDLFYIDLFRTNIHQRTPQEPQPNPPPEPWPYD
jgi:Ca-activated chloride channel family protein